MDVFEAMEKRRSVRKMTDEDLPQENLDKMLVAGGNAPSWVNFQVWEIITVRNKEMKAKLAATLPDTNPARKAVAAAPVVLVACGRKGESGFKKGKQTTILGDFLMFDVALFLHNVTLAAHAMGWGTVHVGLFDHNQVARLLGVPDNVQVVELLPIGRPVDPNKRGPKRRSPTEFIHSEKY